MGEQTAIEWCDATFNPWEGCQKVGPGCDNCYAETRNARFNGTAINWGPGAPRRRTSAANWHKPVKWDADAKVAGARPFVFCASLADVFDNAVDPAWRADLFDLIRKTPNLVWLLLTKRIGNAPAMIRECGGLPGNVAIGATMVSQEEYDRDAVKLYNVKVAFKPLFTFGSFEPLLGPIRLGPITAPDWIIVGGESGRNARPMNLDWPRDMQFDADGWGRVFNFKQVGGRGSDKGGHMLDGRTYFDRPAIAMPCLHEKPQALSPEGQQPGREADRPKGPVMTPPQSPEAIELDRLHEAATPGPWRPERRQHESVVLHSKGDGYSNRLAQCCQWSPAESPRCTPNEAEANAALIVALRNNLPRIIAGLDLLATQEAMVNEAFGLETGDE